MKWIKVYLFFRVSVRRSSAMGVESYKSRDRNSVGEHARSGYSNAGFYFWNHRRSDQADDQQLNEPIVEDSHVSTKRIRYVVVLKIGFRKRTHTD